MRRQGVFRLLFCRADAAWMPERENARKGRSNGGFMSLGYYGICRLEAEDDHAAVYSYRGENWNLSRDVRNELGSVAGSFTVMKNSLEEAEVVAKRCKVNGRKKTVAKRVFHSPDVVSHIKRGDVVLDEPCGVDRLEMEESGHALPRTARHLIAHVYERYMRDGALPEVEEFLQ